jgi:predicted metalloprotease with PDZ domain
VNPGAWDVDPYTFDDVVSTLNDIAPYDWKPYLRTRLDGHGPLIGGLEAHGWKLVYNDKPSDAIKAAEAFRHSADFTYSLGVMMGADGNVGDVLWDGPAFNAGLSPGMKVIAVNGQAYTPEVMTDAVKASATDTNQPIELLVQNFNEYKTLRIDYHGGLKYPHIERDTSKPDTLSELIKAR